MKRYLGLAVILSLSLTGLSFGEGTLTCNATAVVTNKTVASHNQGSDWEWTAGVNNIIISQSITLVDNNGVLQLSEIEKPYLNSFMGQIDMNIFAQAIQYDGYPDVGAMGYSTTLNCSKDVVSHKVVRVKIYVDEQYDNGKGHRKHDSRGWACREFDFDMWSIPPDIGFRFTDAGELELANTNIIPFFAEETRSSPECKDY